MSEYVTNQAWFCSQCGRKNEPGGIFCGGCGNRAPQWAVAPAVPVEQDDAWFCPQCGHKNSAAGAFCPQCGTGRTAPAAAPAPAAAAPAAAPVEVPAAAPVVPEEPPKKKKKKGLVVGLIALILVVLLAGGAAVWHFFLREDPAPAADEEVETGDEQDEDEEENGASAADDSGAAAGDDTAAPATPEEEEGPFTGTYVEQDEDGVSTYFYEEDVLVRREKEYDDGGFKINTFQFHDNGSMSEITWEEYNEDGVLMSSGIEYLDEDENSTGYDSCSYYPNGQIHFEHYQRLDENGREIYSMQYGYAENGTLIMESRNDTETGEEYYISYEGDWIYDTRYQHDENGNRRQEIRDYRNTATEEWQWEAMEYDEYGNMLYHESQNHNGYSYIYTYEYLDPARGLVSWEYYETGDGYWSEAVYIYDDNDLAVERVENTGGNGTAGGSTTTYTYNELNQCVYMQEVYLDGRTEDTYLTYDQWGNVVLEEWTNSRGDYQIEQYSYDAEGRQLYASMENGNGYSWEQRHEYFETGALKLYEFHQINGTSYERYEYSEYSEEGWIAVERGWTMENGEITEEYERIY